METWQMIVSFCASIITILTLAEKIRGTNSFKQLDSAMGDLKTVPQNIATLKTDLTQLSSLQISQNAALLALLRNDLYRCFKDNRDIAAWTDDDARVQTTLHEVYRALNGNGEEEIWWEKKKTWRIVSDTEYHELVRLLHEKKFA